MLLTFSLFALLQLPQQGVPQTNFQGATTPPSGDTVGYWQQRVHYQIVATLDEAATNLHSTATLTYVNNSPDTLREMFFHQYLNAFRPGSKWSAVDIRENRERFQHLGDRDIGYERFTQAPVVGGTPVIVDYPGAPDSTVVHFRLPRPLAPHDSLVIQLAWDARPSTVTRRQGRKGRTYDFAQWYPKVAVYDRGGWEPNPLVPAGELYGEYGTYEVAMIVRDDQVIASTGVPVAGDPGWARVSRNGAPYLAANAYGNVGSFARVQPPDGYRVVTFRAENVHHFAWSASPDYRYEGGVYVRRVPATHFPTWDTVAVHVLYKADDDTTWGGGRALERTLFAARWLESVWGPYAYPQITNVHRLDPGGTEFPMMVMNGSASQGLILHEFGHVFTYGILGNNEWRSGWMDEGLTDYQTDWAQKLTPQDRDRVIEPPRLAEGYRVNAVTIPKTDSLGLSENRLELLGRTQPIGTPAYDFTEFGIYNEMIYNRAKVMYGQLRELMGDSVFLRFTHDYYDRWALKHVDERAMRASAERAYGRPLGWFFDEWVHRTGLMDYELGPYSVRTDGSNYETLVTVQRRGALRHPMPIGVRTDAGWTIGRADPSLDGQVVRIVTKQQPREVQLDPYHATFDWDRRNDVGQTTLLAAIPEPKVTFNWPWFNQSDRTHTIVALAPTAWYSNPQGVAAGIRAKSSYLSMVDEYDAGLAVASRAPAGSSGFAPTMRRIQAWARGENLYLPGFSRPLMGVGGGVNYLDGLFKADLYRHWDLSPFIFTPGPAIGARVYATVAAPTDSLLLPEQWANVSVAELGGSGSYRTAVLADSGYAMANVSLGGGATTSGPVGSGEASRGYLRAEASVGAVQPLAGMATQLHARLYGGIARNAPRQRAIFASTRDPFETFTNDLFRPRGALFKQDGINYLPLGGAGLRGFGIDTPLDRVAAVNGELLQRLGTSKGGWGRATLSFSVFGDAGVGSSKYVALSDRFLSDAGVGLVAQGKLYDRDVHVRLDAPIFVNRVDLAGGRGLGGNGSLAPRWTITVGDLW
ncbi:MAG TPA: M1 family metallopeptidase [Gemmatimonadaceae bacterium]|nr:M1 family metallopeptidase [Gemmatimonadaceae bacterium]